MSKKSAEFLAKIATITIGTGAKLPPLKCACGAEMKCIGAFKVTLQRVRPPARKAARETSFAA